MVVTAVKDLKMKRGSTGSRVFECDDGGIYFVKFKDSTRTVVNEYVGYALAGLLELPVPEHREVFVSDRLILDSADLKAQGVLGGLHHGTLWMNGCADFRGRLVRGLNLGNSAMLPGIIVLDNLVLNLDRNNPGNNLIQSTTAGPLYKTVDFSEILSGRSWTVETLQANKNATYLVPVFPVLALTVNGIASFSPWLEKIEGFSEERIDGILAGIPSGWNLTEAERASVRDFILTRKMMVRRILIENRARFLNWGAEPQVSPGRTDGSPLLV